VRPDRDWIDVVTVLALVAAFVAAGWAAEESERLATATLDATSHSDSAARSQHLDTLNLIHQEEETSKRQLRAYLGVDRFELKAAGLTDPDYKPVDRVIGYVHRDFLEVTLRNFGQTPAYDVHVWVNWQPTPFGQTLPSGFSYPDTGIGTRLGPMLSREVLNRDQTHTEMIAIFDLSPFILTQRKLTMLYLYGHIDYRDIYGNKWQATFCESWEPWSTVNVEFVPCNNHNEEMIID
jgi:hypothetical protein